MFRVTYPLKSSTLNFLRDGRIHTFITKLHIRLHISLAKLTSYSLASLGVRLKKASTILDTVILCGNSFDVGRRSLLAWILSRRRIPNRPDPQWAEEAERQWLWIEKQLRESM